MAKESDLLLVNSTLKMKKAFKTKTLTATMAVSKTETGLDYVQVIPDNPCVGQVEKFHGMGYGQMLSNGTFDFVRKKRTRGKPEFRVDYGSLSFSNDGNDRVIFTVPSEMRDELPKLLSKGVKEINKYLQKKGYSR